MVLENQGERGSRWAAVVSIAAKIDCSAQTLNEWLKKAEVDIGKRAGVPSDVSEKMKLLERENREVRPANEILRKASAYCPGGARPPVQAMTQLIDDHREELGSSRSAGFCRSPDPLTTSLPPGVAIPRDLQHARSAIRH